APVVAEVRRRLGNFILCEDDQTLEGVVLSLLTGGGHSLATVETFTAGQIAARMAHLPGAEARFRRGIIARDLVELGAMLDLGRGRALGEHAEAGARTVAEAARRQSGASHALAVLVELDDRADGIDFGGSLHIAIASGDGTAYRRARVIGGRDWVRL